MGNKSRLPKGKAVGQKWAARRDMNQARQAPNRAQVFFTPPGNKPKKPAPATLGYFTGGTAINPRRTEEKKAGTAGLSRRHRLALKHPERR